MSVDLTEGQLHVVIVGGGFAGVGCARRLADHDDVRVTLIDRNNYHQFQPLLYQVATSQLASSDIAYSLRKLFHDRINVDVKLGEVASLDPATHSVTTTDGEVFSGDALVLAAGSQPNFFRTPGADDHAFPLYSLDDAQRLRSRILGVFEDADRDPALIDQGALNFVIVGGGPTGVEVAGALADLIHDTMSAEYHHLAVSAAQVHVVDLGHTLLGAFSDKAHDYVAKVLGKQGRPPAPRRGGDRDRARARDARRRLDDQDALRDLGRRHHGSDGRRRRRAAAGTRRAHRRAARPHGRRPSGRLRHRRRGQHPQPRRRVAPAARARSRCRAASRRPTTCSPTSRASRARPSTTTTRASWR